MILSVQNAGIQFGCTQSEILTVIGAATATGLRKRRMTMEIDKKIEFGNELRSLLNRYSIENESDTPDFILAAYLLACLAAFNNSVKERQVWYGESKTVPVANATGHA